MPRNKNRKCITNSLNKSVVQDQGTICFYEPPTGIVMVKTATAWTSEEIQSFCEAFVQVSAVQNGIQIKTVITQV